MALGTFDKKNEIRFEVLKMMVSHQEDADKQKHRPFMAWGIPLCEAAVSEILSCSKPTIKKFRTHLAEGQTRVQPGSDKRLAAGMILNWATYLNLLPIFFKLVLRPLVRSHFDRNRNLLLPTPPGTHIPGGVLCRDNFQGHSRGSRSSPP